MRNHAESNPHDELADSTGSRIRELSAGSLVLGVVVGFVIALVRPRSWR